ncbi:hypothetical protein IJF81_03585 [bacterium]|nr:hypothetical protein [bacterium]
MKYIIFVAIIAICAFCYFNHTQVESLFDFNKAKNQSEQTFSKEKTIFGVNNARSINNKATEEALKDEY